MHMYVLVDNDLTVIPCAVNGKGGMIITLPLTIALSKKNTHLAWFTTTRPLNKYKRTRTQHSAENGICLLYTSPSPRDGLLSRMPSSA